jgi:putative methionine-R-sulfoxide reductase with GAF domain
MAAAAAGRAMLGAMRTKAISSRAERARDRRLEELEFLAEVARLVGSARTWDELMGTIVDRATAAADAEVCSLYLMDRDGTGVTLAATEGLDPESIGVARLPLGVGITGRVAETRKPITSINVHRDQRFHYIRGVDQPRYTSMCSVPLIWNDQVVGVLNVQTVRRRASPPATLASSRRSPRCSPASSSATGCSARPRPGREPARDRRGARPPGGRRDPCAAHAAGRGAGLRRAARRRGTAVWSTPTRPSGSAGPGAGRTARPDRRLDPGQPARATTRRVATGQARPVPRWSARPRSSWRRSSAAIGWRPTSSSNRCGRSPPRNRCTDCWATCSRTRRSTHPRTARSTSTAGGAPIARSSPSPTTGRASRRVARAHLRALRRLDESPRGAGIGLFAARHLARSMGGDLRAEQREPRGSQFVLELPAVGRSARDLRPEPPVDDEQQQGQHDSKQQ